ncbi:MAG: SOS response-associated peptidase [Ancrocorticia sp.]
MCGRYASFSALTDIQLAFDLDALGPECEVLTPSWNVAPTQDVGIVVERILDGHPSDIRAVYGTQIAGVPTKEPDSSQGSHSVTRELHVARWGLVPPWSKDPSKGPQMINARIETLAEKRTFAPSLGKRRCIVPADGYFEWQATAGGKIPHYIHATDAAPLAFAGLYGWWKKPDGSWLLSTTIITRAAEGDLAAIHDRTPIVLTPDEFAAWLDPHQEDKYAALQLIDRSNQPLQADVVGKAVGNIRNNSPENIRPVVN